MERRKGGHYVRIAILVMLALGVALMVTSAFYASSFVAIVGLAIIFWAAILFYIKPVKHVPLTLLYASAEAISTNIERVLVELKLIERGVYLPPKNLRDIESSLVFVPTYRKTALPTPEENHEKLYCEVKSGVLLSPPGLELCRMFEQELGISFTKTDLSFLQSQLPRLLTGELELAKNCEMNILNEKVTVELNDTIFSELCQQTNHQRRTHTQIGCLISSAIACALAKAAGEPVTILNETQKPENRTVKIEYRIEAPVLISNEEGVPIIFGKELEIAPAYTAFSLIKQADLPPAAVKPEKSQPPPLAEAQKNGLQPPENPVVVISDEHVKRTEATPTTEAPVIVLQPQATEKQEPQEGQKSQVSIVEQPAIPVIIIGDEDARTHEPPQVAIRQESPQEIESVPKPTKNVSSEVTTILTKEQEVTAELTAISENPSAAVQDQPNEETSTPLHEATIDSPAQATTVDISPTSPETPEEEWVTEKHVTENDGVPSERTNQIEPSTEQPHETENPPEEFQWVREPTPQDTSSVMSTGQETEEKTPEMTPPPESSSIQEEQGEETHGQEINPEPTTAGIEKQIFEQLTQEPKLSTPPVELQAPMKPAATEEPITIARKKLELPYEFDLTESVRQEPTPTAEEQPPEVAVKMEGSEGDSVQPDFLIMAPPAVKKGQVVTHPSSVEETQDKPMASKKYGKRPTVVIQKDIQLTGKKDADGKSDKQDPAHGTEE